MADIYTITIPAVSDPITFADFDEWGRDIDAVDTALVNSLISAATQTIEKATNRVFMVRTITGNFDMVCNSKFENWDYIEIKKSPILAVSAVRVNGTVLTVSTEYILKNKPGYSRILFNKSLPVLDVDLAYPIEVDFTAGYADLASVPDEIKTAIKQLVLFWYENRGDVSPDAMQKIPLVVKAIINQFRIVNSYG